MAKNYSGRDLNLYVSASSPATATISTSYTAVGLMTALSISRSRGAIDKSNKDDGDESTFIGGRRNSTLSGTAIFDHTSNAGQAILNTAFASGTGSIWFLISTLTVGDLEWYGEAVITSYNTSHPDEDKSQVDFTFQITGALTEVNNITTT